MTRINVIPVTELLDQWLLAEYRELPRVIKQDINILDDPDKYLLGKGHMKWAKKHSWWLFVRYKKLCEEMIHRGFTVNYPWKKLIDEYYPQVSLRNDNDYTITEDDIELSRQRLCEKYQLKPQFYKWTNRNKPLWITNSLLRRKD